MHHPRWRRTAWAALYSGTLGAFAWWRGALTPSGVAGAMLTGTSITGGGGWDWGAALVYFFVSSSALSRLASRRKLATAADKFDKGSRRDLGQALANGGVASVLGLLRATPWGARHAAGLANAFVGALAAANSDTWATELGTLSSRQPRLITTGKPVVPGTSGGVTPLGLAAATAGAVSLGLAFAALAPDPNVCPTLHVDASMPNATPVTLSRSAGHSRPVESGVEMSAGHRQRPLRARVQDSRGPFFCRVYAATVGGLAGSLADSLLGATVQAMYWCPHCLVETERRMHRCGTPTTRLRGVRWIDNDAVNVACTVVGALSGLLVGALWGEHP